MLSANAVSVRVLRDGRRLAEIHCPFCRLQHWLMLDHGCTLGYAPCGANRPLWVDGLGSPAR
jgi:hypothetical protein